MNAKVTYAASSHERKIAAEQMRVRILQYGRDNFGEAWDLVRKSGKLALYFIVKVNDDGTMTRLIDNEYEINDVFLVLDGMVLDADRFLGE